MITWSTTDKTQKRAKSPLIDAFINKLWSREKMEDQPSTNNASGLRPVTPTVICCSRVPQHGCI